MNFFERCANLAVYEWRRAFAKKKFIVLVVLAVALQIFVFLSFNFILNDPPEGFDIDTVKATMWIVGILGPQELFMPLIATVIAGGAMSEEYEQGSADILLSKPIRKVEYMTGKYVGGFALSSFVIAIITVLGVVFARGFFGPQESILVVPIIFLTMVYSNLLFFSLSFMFSEVFRRTTIALLATIGIFVASMIIGGYLSVIQLMTGGEFYLNIIRLLPNWSVSTFPSFVASKFITVNNPFMTVSGGNSLLAAGIIAVYAVVSIFITSRKLFRSDVTKKVT